MKYHVLTPLTRFQNLKWLHSMLRPMGIDWHLIVDQEQDLKWKIEFEDSWIGVSWFPKADGQNQCLLALNWWIANSIIFPEDRYCFLNDDDGLPPDFFEQLNAHPGEILITSMQRGDNIPPGVEKKRAFETNTLIAAPENMKWGLVSIEQLIVSGRILKTMQFPDRDIGDGLMIEKLVAENPVTYVPETSAWFNYLEPGRWNASCIVEKTAVSSD